MVLIPGYTFESTEKFLLVSAVFTILTTGSHSRKCEEKKERKRERKRKREREKGKERKERGRKEGRKKERQKERKHESVSGGRSWA